MENIFVFIYAKNKQIKALNIEESKRLDAELKSDVDMFDEVKSLSKCVS